MDDKQRTVVDWIWNDKTREPFWEDIYKADDDVTDVEERYEGEYWTWPADKPEMLRRRTSFWSRTGEQ